MITQGHLPPPLTSTVKSSLFTYSRSSSLSLAARQDLFGNINVAQTVLILTVAGLFLDRPCLFIYNICWCISLFIYRQRETLKSLLSSMARKSGYWRKNLVYFLSFLLLPWSIAGQLHTYLKHALCPRHCWVCKICTCKSLMLL